MAGSRQGGSDILARIVESKLEEAARLSAREDDLRAAAASAPPTRDFAGAMADPRAVSLIAEVKRRSPGAGEIRPGLEPTAIARSYASGGAAAISVLTDEAYFGGSLADLTAVREAVALPVLRKDFILEPVQLWESRAAGADAVLLIVRILEDMRLRELRLLAARLGMAALVEAHDRVELERALASGATLVGINNRDLRTFTTRIDTTLDLVESVPEEVVVVSESGIRASADVERLGAAGVDGILVGESLLRSPDPGAAAGLLTGIPLHRRGER